MPGAILVSFGTSTPTGGSFQATANRSHLTGFIAATPGTAQTTQATTVTAINGTPPYTYQWTFVSGDNEIYPNSSVSATTRFSKYIGTPGSADAVYKCEVTDDTATTVDSQNVTVHLEGN